MSLATPSPARLLRFGARATAPRRRLFCFPFAGGGAATFRPWARARPADVEVLAVQLPGRESRVRERPLDAIADMVAAALPAVAEAAELPYALFGHSMGALVAFELALALEAGEAARGPAHLYVSARRPPDEPDPLPPISALPDDAFLDEVQRRHGGVPDAVRREPELLALLMPALRADYRALERYEAPVGRRVRCPVHVYGGATDRHPAPALLAGWQRVAARPARVRVFEGGHFYLAAQHEAVAADIAAHWAEAPAARGAP